jgi:pimeloyl-ACP methyl ester carboxylesterase
VLYFHGTPASRLGMEFAAATARTLGVRLLGMDRPGHGNSSFQAGRRLLDWPADVRAFADGLGLERFGVLGWSGGGPYVAACAYALPDRLMGAVISSGVGPLNRAGALESMSALDQWLGRLSLRAPWAARALLGTMVWAAKRWPERAYREFLNALPESDRAALEASGAVPAEAMAFFVESARHGTRGPVWDYRVMTLPWGFRPKEIRVPVHLWHGDEDSIVPLGQAQELAARIPAATLTVCPGEGHLLIYRHIEAMLRAASGAPVAEVNHVTLSQRS